MRAKIDESGSRRGALAIDVARNDGDAIARRRAANRSVA